MARLNSATFAVAILILSTSAGYCTEIAICNAKAPGDCRLGSPDIEARAEPSNFGACGSLKQYSGAMDLKGRDRLATNQSSVSDIDFRSVASALGAIPGSSWSTIEAGGEPSSVQQTSIGSDEQECAAAPCQSPTDESCSKYIGDMPLEAEAPAPAPTLLVWATQLFSASEPR